MPRWKGIVVIVYAGIVGGMLISLPVSVLVLCWVLIARCLF